MDKNKKTKTKKGIMSNVVEWIEENLIDSQLIRYNLLRDRIEMFDLKDQSGYRNLDESNDILDLNQLSPTGWRDLNERDLNEMTRQCCLDKDIMIKPGEMDSVLKSHLIPSVDPLKDYLNSLEPYNPRQDGDWIQFVADMVRIKGGHYPLPGQILEPSTEPDIVRERWNKCFRRWFLAMVESWRKDEVINHQVLVLIGRQGIYKTTWLESLLPPSLRDYVTKFSGTFDKDDRLRIAESGLINIDEIDAMSPRELNKMKTLITASDINERKAFGHNKERRHRVASFCASGNRREFLTDTTGNRRWLSFEVEQIDNPLQYFPIVRYDRLYAQAIYCLDTLHEKFWFDADDIEDIELQNSDFRAMDSEEELLPILFDIPASDATGEQVKLLTTAEISAKLIAYGNIRKPMPLNRLSTILRRLGFEQSRCGKMRSKRWRVYERNSDEINLLRK